MGIFKVKSSNCECTGSWATLDSDHRIYMSRPCSKHELKSGNKIYYELSHLLYHITKTSTLYQPKYLVKILDVKDFDKNKKCIKIELTHNSEINVVNFDKNKNIIYSQFNDEPMWTKIDDYTTHFIVLYQGCHHTIEKQWEREDY